MSVHFETARDRLDAIAAQWAASGSQDRNEATTRLHLIDELLTGALGWQKSHVRCEHSHGTTYADYALGTPATRLIVEAKREGISFELPVGVGSGVMRIKTVMSADGSCANAIRQVLSYCHERGVALAAVSNGHQMVAFVASRQDGVPPLDGKALVFDSLPAMQSHFDLL